MSIKAFGTLEFYSKENLDIIKSSFEIVVLSANHGIGINLGGNVNSYLDYKTENTYIKYELLDNPLDVNAQGLFMGDGIEYLVNGESIDNGESLEYRLKKIQKLFKDMINIMQIYALIF